MGCDGVGGDVESEVRASAPLLCVLCSSPQRPSHLLREEGEKGARGEVLHCVLCLERLSPLSDTFDILDNVCSGRFPVGSAALVPAADGDTSMEAEQQATTAPADKPTEELQDTVGSGLILSFLCLGVSIRFKPHIHILVNVLL